MTLSAGEAFAGYTIVRQIGAGGMGEVYLAQHPRLPRQEALKVLRPEISSDETFRQRFIREADSIAALEHSHIVTVHDRGNTEDRLWIATQYVEGVDAAQLLRDRYPAGMPTDEAVAITSAIADALDHAHDRGLLHRDVKPANILLAQPDRNGTRRIYLADFGIARPLDDPSGLTSTNFTLGTFAYAAPEQLMGKAIDGRADQYALAATAYHLLTGTPVFPDSNQIAVISQHLSQPAPALSKIRPELAPLDAAFARALAKNPEERFPNCQEFAQAITAATTSRGESYSPTAPTQEAPVPPVERTAPKESSHRSHAPTLTAAAAVLGLVAGGALLWHPWSKQDQTSTPSATSMPPTAATATTSTTPTTSSTAIPAPPPPVPTETTPTKAAPISTVKLYDECTNFGATGAGSDGTTYYCAQLGGTEGYIWALAPGRGAPNPYPRPGSNSQNAVYGPVTCKLSSSGGLTWQPGTSEPPAVVPPQPPRFLGRCAEIGSSAFGPEGVLVCTQANLRGYGEGWYWLRAP